MDKVDEYRSLLSGYQQGIYTDSEVVSKALELLFLSDNREALWAAFTSRHRDLMAQFLYNFDEAAEPFAINADPFEVWREMSALKQWLASR